MREARKVQLAVFVVQFCFVATLSTGTYLIGQRLAAAQSPDYTPPPGALNPQVTQTNIASTICTPGWTRTIRPPASYTNALKLKQMKERHLPGTASAYEEDHAVNLSIGGHPTDPRNLWPMRWPLAKKKDALENALQRAVCGLQLTLRIAQQCIQQDWVACARKMHTPVP